MGDALWGDRPEREGRIEELVGVQNSGPEAPPRSRKRQENRGKRRCQERSDCHRGAMEKGRCVKVIEEEEVRRNVPVEYFLPAGVGSTS